MNDPKTLEAIKKIVDYNNAIEATLKEICQPLNDLGIHYFYYGKFYINGLRQYISTNADFFKTLVEKNIGRSTTFHNELLDALNHKVRQRVWVGQPPDDQHEILFNLDIWNGYTIYTNNTDHIEVWGFGSRRENIGIVEFYLNYPEILNHFVLYFKNKAHKLIEPSKNNLIQTGIMLCENLPPRQDFSPFLQNMPINKLYLKGGVVITKREAECLYHLSRGNSMKQIAKVLNISPRTVEIYIEKLRYKTNAYCRSELTELFTNSPISQIMKR